MLSLKTFLLLTSSALVAACGTISNKTGVDLLPAAAFNSPNEGVVIVSAGAPEHCMSQATFLSLRELAGKKVVPSISSIGVDVYVHKSEFADHHGTVNALRLPAGSYYFTPSIANPHVRTVIAPTFEFEVKAGETTYVGELFMTKACALNTRFEVRDQFDRDMALASRKNPAVAGRAAIRRLMKPGSPSNES